jgi:hypothetical protein
LADSAYSPTFTDVPILKNRASGFTEREQTFNWEHARARVKIEHCIGMLKGRFQSLRELRYLIKCKEDVGVTSIWIRVCTNLHNFLLTLRDDIDSDWEAVNTKIVEEVDDVGSVSSSHTLQSRMLAHARNGAEKRDISINIINDNL